MQTVIGMPLSRARQLLGNEKRIIVVPTTAPGGRAAGEERVVRITKCPDGTLQLVVVYHEPPVRCDSDG